MTTFEIYLFIHLLPTIGMCCAIFGFGALSYGLFSWAVRETGREGEGTVPALHFVPLWVLLAGIGVVLPAKKTMLLLVAWSLGVDVLADFTAAMELLGEELDKAFEAYR